MAIQAGAEAEVFMVLSRIPQPRPQRQLKLIAQRKLHLRGPASSCTCRTFPRSQGRATNVVKRTVFVTLKASQPELQNMRIVVQREQREFSKAGIGDNEPMRRSTLRCPLSPASGLVYSLSATLGSANRLGPPAPTTAGAS